MNVKRIARYLKGVPIAKCLIEINRFPPFVNVYTDTPNVQEHQRWSHAVEEHDSFCLVENTSVSELEFCRSRIMCSDN